MHVLVIREFVNNSKDFRFIMVAHAGDDTSMISPVVTLERAAHRVHWANGNPYLVYGDACAKFTGKDKFDLHITVAECTSGDLSGW